MTNPIDQWSTWREIHSQSEVWDAWGKTLDLKDLRYWLAGLKYDEIWLCGAGTSAYIGEIIAAGVPGVRAVASTDLVAAPKTYLNGIQPLVVSFGRSGNSSESIGTLDALDVLAPHAPRLNITCNKDGALATRPTQAPQKVIVLPPETHDTGFAMTSSFSTMFYTALALFDAPCDLAERMSELAQQLAKLMPTFGGVQAPERAVYVGSGPLAFGAREAALKVMELSAGQIPALWDSSLGFRHGPKAFVTDNTEITVFLSPDAPTRNYDTDLVNELRAQFPKARVISVGPGGDIDIAMPYGATWAAPLCIATAQINGAMWSHDLGLNVDNPFSGQGTLSRVVSGVQLYPVAR